MLQISGTRIRNYQILEVFVSIFAVSTVSGHLDKEAGEEEERAKYHDAEGARKHGILKGFHHLARRAGGAGWESERSRGRNEDDSMCMCGGQSIENEKDSSPFLTPWRMYLCITA